VHEPVDLGLGQRHGLVARTDEAGHTGRVLDQVPSVVGHLHVHQDVTGHGALLDRDALAVLQLGDLLGRDDHAAHPLARTHRLDAVLEVVLDLVLVTRIGVDHVPAKHLLKALVLLGLGLAGPR
jgi:hypothetical protein